AHQTDPVPGVDAKVGAGQELPGSDSDLDILGTDHPADSTAATASAGKSNPAEVGRITRRAGCGLAALAWCRPSWTLRAGGLQNTGGMSVTYRPWAEGDEVAARAAFGPPDTPQAELDRTLLGPDASAPWRH